MDNRSGVRRRERCPYCPKTVAAQPSGVQLYDHECRGGERYRVVHEQVTFEAEREAEKAHANGQKATGARGRLPREVVAEASLPTSAELVEEISAADRQVEDDRLVPCPECGHRVGLDDAGQVNDHLCRDGASYYQARLDTLGKRQKTLDREEADYARRRYHSRLDTLGNMLRATDPDRLEDLAPEDVRRAQAEPISYPPTNVALLRLLLNHGTDTSGEMAALRDEISALRRRFVLVMWVDAFVVVVFCAVVLITLVTP